MELVEMAALGFGAPSLTDLAREVLHREAPAASKRMQKPPGSVNTKNSTNPRIGRIGHLLTWIDANSWPLAVAMVCFAPRARRRHTLQRSHRRRQELSSAAEETGLGRCMVRLALPTIQEESSSINTSIEPSPREEEAGRAAKQPLEVHPEDCSNLSTGNLPMDFALANAQETLIAEMAKNEPLPLPTISQSFASTNSSVEAVPVLAPAPARATSAPGFQREARAPLSREEALRRLNQLKPQERGTRPLFSAAELVPFFEEPAPRLQRLLEEGSSGDSEADPWETFFLEEDDDAVGAGSSIGNAFRSAFGHSSVKRGCLPWLVQLSPPSSRCMSPSRESTCVPEESLPKSAWTSDEDGREF
ncbi:unnamed protein product [Cladocopium goreaui]|uniref:Uncharacterized protein n=1 Tax=Cladocopium goreaui TaxID=2562237 RepID=A0A9P1C5I8_9DINO|nr:unnamed protein product [Cladocopium goreaui]